MIVTPLAPPAPPPRVSSKGPLIPLPCCLEESLYHTGKLIYNLYGQKTEEAFVKNWGVGLAIEQAQSFQDLVSSAAQAFAILLLLDLLLVGPARWFEEVRVPSAHGAAGKASSVPAGH